MTCPSSAPVPETSGGCTASKSLSSLQENSSSVVPFPMLLSCIAFCISVYFSKYEKPQTFVPGCIVGFCSIFEWISWIILIAITSSHDGSNITTVLAILGFIIVYAFNLVSLLKFRKIILNDPLFDEWKSNPKNYVCYKLVIVLSTLLTFKLQKILFC